MSGGISAIRGFDYQATVILEMLFEHFEQHGPSASVRPEGQDDLDLRWTEAGVDCRRFVQIKKPTEDALTRPAPSPWTLADVARELLPDAITRLMDNDHKQVWVLGDEVAPLARRVLEARPDEYSKPTSEYWSMIHSLARKKAQAHFPSDSAVAKAAAKWRVPKSLPIVSTETLSALATAANTFAQRHDPTGTEFAQIYIQETVRLHTHLPGILHRIQIFGSNGTEVEVAERVMLRLERSYGLQRSVIEHTLFRNLRGFINDISKQPARSFNRVELETELRCVWPQMVPIKAPPPLEEDYVRRPALVASLTDPWTGAAIEVSGISGSGKTRLATEALELSQQTRPNRITLYAEVRSGVSLRDCLVGTTFHLRRLGIEKPFSVAIQPDKADEGVLIDLADVLSEISNECLLLLDLVEGNEPSGFARDLATFIRAMKSNMLRLMIFGQERGLRELNNFEQMQLGVRSLNAPGLSFEEFVTLVGQHHANPDRARLHSLYQQITAGRATGLYVSLAQALARSRTIDEMAAVTALPAEDRLASAERSRFARVSESARIAAEKLTCFALPFSRSEAEEVFLNENIGRAIRELLDLGLLRRHDNETFEMHETVRAGLEQLISPQTRRNAHGELAAWYQVREQIGAVIFHLEQAGQRQEAQIKARDAFLKGNSWNAIWPYVNRNKLISAHEVVIIIADLKRVKADYLLPDIFKELEGAPQALWDLIHEQSARMFADPEWARPIFEALIELEPSYLDDLLQLIVQHPHSPEARADALTWLSIASRRRKGTIAPSTLALLDRQSEVVQRSMLTLFLHSGRTALEHALHHIWKNPNLIEPGHGRGSSTFYLKIYNPEDVTDLLMAIPQVSITEMVRTRGPLMGSIGSLVWRERKHLQAPCVAVLQAQILHSDALVNAIRILLYLGEPTILDLCTALCIRSDSAGALAKLIPAMVPALVDWHSYEAEVQDDSVEFSLRAQALITLAWSGSRLDNVLERLKLIDSPESLRWVPILRILATVTPFVAAIPILEEELTIKDEKRELLVPSIITQQGQVPGPSVTKLLLRALTHHNPWIRVNAATALTRRRDRAALPHLIRFYRQETVSEVQVVLAATILASGATSAADLTGCIGTPAAELWWCVLANRTRDLNAAERLVSIAIDHDQPWQVRRAAIAAAGRLPYEESLAHIESAVMAERSPLRLDHHRSLLTHDAITSIIPEAAWSMRQIYHSDRAGFINCFEPYFNSFWKGSLDPAGLPTGSVTATWLYDQLESTELDKLLNALHIPLLQAAVLRSLRLCERPDRIDVHMAEADHVWLAVRALLERSKLEERGPELSQRLQALVARAMWNDDSVVNDLLNKLAILPAANTEAEIVLPHVSERKQLANSPLSFQTVVRLLSGDLAELLPDTFLVLEPLEIEQCKTLISLAEPARDPVLGETIFTAAVAFTKEGHRVGQSFTSYGGGKSLPNRLRPAIAAANTFGLQASWHTKQLHGPLSETYTSDFLACIAAQGNAERFYTAMAEAEETLMPALCKEAHSLSAQLEIDGRLIPSLTRFLHVGDDDFFEGICILAKQVTVPEIQPVLESLLHRWTQRFDIKADHPQNNEAFSLWNALFRLTENQYFNTIPNWAEHLQTVLMAPMSWYHSQSIVRILERDPGSYFLIEARLFKESNWEHYFRDEVDRLDCSADTLFSKVQNTAAH
ncbi:HEAT repeat domain-containing protein [Pseudomonas asplenii]|uniref:HEAT repeat n=1 Tax=Pseudomonas asplenii TaxID=53407 RepID=A0A1H6NZD0_9PSED|nr:HEAT repeat domain-containing protein [Pseudomonas fuscovaginae]SEI17332.1 HEAT repeat [Pseudomonas fuscovaginae]